MSRDRNAMSRVVKVRLPSILRPGYPRFPLFQFNGRHNASIFSHRYLPVLITTLHRVAGGLRDAFHVTPSTNQRAGEMGIRILFEFDPSGIIVLPSYGLWRSIFGGDSLRGIHGAPVHFENFDGKPEYGP